MKESYFTQCNQLRQKLEKMDYKVGDLHGDASVLLFLFKNKKLFIFTELVTCHFDYLEVDGGVFENVLDVVFINSKKNVSTLVSEYLQMTLEHISNL